MHVYYDVKDVDLPVLPECQYYIYVVENAPQGNVKIGRSHDICQRLRSLSGSNSGGNTLFRVAVSDATWLYSIERTAQGHFAYANVKGTEWFSGVSFEDVVSYISSLFAKESYNLCNETRRFFTERHKQLHGAYLKCDEEKEGICNERSGFVSFAV